MKLHSTITETKTLPLPRSGFLVRHRKTICCLLLGIALVGCGGAAGDDTSDPEPVGGNSPKAALTPANNLREFIVQIRARYPNAAVLGLTAFMDVWNPIQNYPKAFAMTNLNTNPISGAYNSYSARNYPVSNGQMVFGNTGANLGRMTYQNVDLINGSTAAGDAQSFYGVQEANSFPIGVIGFTGGSVIPTTIVTEDLVRDSSGVLQYRSLRAMLGYLTESAGVLTKNVDGTGGNVTGPPFDGVVGHLFIGYYWQEVIECFVPACKVGTVLNYDIFLAKT